MKRIKRVGIWMDHSKAYLLELTNGTIIENSIVSEAGDQAIDYVPVKHEKKLHTKEQDQLSEYYSKLTGAIRNYHEVVLFGPGEAKNELFYQLRTDHLFDDIIIVIKDSDKMSDRKMHEFVREFFKPKIV